MSKNYLEDIGKDVFRLSRRVNRVEGVIQLLLN
jgi:hypothetical protein